MSLRKNNRQNKTLFITPGRAGSTLISHALKECEANIGSEILVDVPEYVESFIKEKMNLHTKEDIDSCDFIKYIQFYFEHFDIGKIVYRRITPMVLQYILSEDYQIIHLIRNDYIAREFSLEHGLLTKVWHTTKEIEVEKIIVDIPNFLEGIQRTLNSENYIRQCFPKASQFYYEEVEDHWDHVFYAICKVCNIDYKPVKKDKIMKKVISKKLEECIVNYEELLDAINKKYPTMVSYHLYREAFKA